MTILPERARTWRTWLVGAGLALALLAAGCGGSSKASPHSAPASSAPASSAPAPATSGPSSSQGSAASPPSTSHAGGESSGIPQSNGGDQDSDNNGGPSDGDGSI